MSQSTLRDWAKFGAGLMVADLATNIWFAYSGLLPFATMGITITENMIWPAIVFDAAILGMLIHYGWHVGSIPALRERSYLLLVGFIFTAVAVVHFARILFGFDIVFVDWTAPHWLSWIGSVVTAYLAYMSFRLAVRRK